MPSYEMLLYMQEGVREMQEKQNKKSLKEL